MTLNLSCGVVIGQSLLNHYETVSPVDASVALGGGGASESILVFHYPVSCARKIIRASLAHYGAGARGAKAEKL